MVIIDARAYFCPEPLLTSDDKPDETKLDLIGLARRHYEGFNPEVKEYQDGCAFSAISIVLIFDTESDSVVSFTLQIRFPQKLQYSPNELLRSSFAQMAHGMVFNDRYILPRNTECAIPGRLSNGFERVIREKDEDQINKWMEKAKEKMLWALERTPVPLDGIGDWQYYLEACAIPRKRQY
ncbi:hypothetical protein FPRO04_13913 [Fusarium proliferatum]|nr:hypothetical protein FPRO04_13913 [Fusarium proliferatum]